MAYGYSRNEANRVAARIADKTEPCDSYIELLLEEITAFVEAVTKSLGDAMRQLSMSAYDAALAINKLGDALIERRADDGQSQNAGLQ
jgi:hypothetical protein